MLALAMGLFHIKIGLPAIVEKAPPALLNTLNDVNGVNRKERGNALKIQGKRDMEPGFRERIKNARAVAYVYMSRSRATVLK